MPVAVAPPAAGRGPYHAFPPELVRAAQPLPQPPPAIERPQEVHVHHHWHGVDAEDAAEILRRQLP
jgi:hypothetical protein